MKIGFVMTGSFCTFIKALRAMGNLVSLGHSVTPILSEHAGGMDTRFGTADDLRERLRNITGSEIIDSIAGAEPIGPKRMFDVLIVVPCTGNTLAKLSHGITDTTAAMAVKSHLRSERPVVLALQPMMRLQPPQRISGKTAESQTLLFRAVRRMIPGEQTAVAGK